MRQLEPPLAEVEDRVMFIPRGSELVVEKNEARLLFVCDGRARLSVDAAQLGEIAPGDILVVMGPSRQVYQAVRERGEPRLHIFRVVFDGSQLSFDPDTGWPAQLGSRHEETDFVVFIQNRFARLRHLRRAITPQMQALLEEIRRDAAARGPGFRHRVGARTRLLVTLVGERIGLPASGVSPKSGPTLAPGQTSPGGATRESLLCDQVKELLLSRHAERLTLQDVASHVRLSAEHVARVFRRATGQTVFEHLRRVRIERARVLLGSSTLSAREIADETGFSSTTLFCRTFKRLTGVTPLAYRALGGGNRSFSASRLQVGRNRNINSSLR